MSGKPGRNIDMRIVSATSKLASSIPYIAPLDELPTVDTYTRPLPGASAIPRGKPAIAVVCTKASVSASMTYKVAAEPPLGSKPATPNRLASCAPLSKSNTSTEFWLAEYVALDE